jgi:hypothetical protein
LLIKNILINQFSVKVKKLKIEAASIYSLPALPRCGQRGLAKYRDSENFKAVARVFYGVKIAPMPPPGAFPARGGTLWRGPTFAWGIVKSAVAAAS